MEKKKVLFFSVNTSVSSRHLTMAEAPGPLISVGDFVNCSGRVCYVESIQNTIGFNQYKLVDIDSGVVLTKARFQINPIEVQYVTGTDSDMDFMDVNIDQLEQTNEGKKENSEERRFSTLSEEDLNNLALNRNCKTTQQQTSWGVAIFKSETLVFPPF